MSRGLQNVGPRRRARRRPPSVVVATAALAAAATVWATVPAAASSTGLTGDLSTTPVRLIVTALDAVVGPVTPPSDLPEEETRLPDPDVRARLLVENLSDVPLVDAKLVVELDAPVTGRADLRAELARSSTGSIGTSVLFEEDLDTIAPGDVAQVILELPGDETDFAPMGLAADEPLRIRPLTIAVLRGAGLLDQVRTAVVGVSGDETPPLETTVVLPIAHEPTATSVAPQPAAGDDEAQASDGDAEEGTAPGVEASEDPGPVDDLAADLLPGGRTDRLVAAVEAAPAGSIAIAPAAHTLEAMVAAGPTAGTSEQLERLRSIADDDSRLVVSSPFALAEVPTLAADDTTAALADRAVNDGRRRLGQALGATIGSAHLSVSPQTPSALDLVPGDLLVSRWDASAGVDLAADPTADVPVALRTAVAPSGRSLRVLVGDPWIEEILTTRDPHGAAVVAHRVIVETAAMFAEDPTTPDRPLVIVPPVAWDAPGVLPSALTRRLADAPWLRLSSPSEVAQRAETGGTAGWAPAPSPSGELDTVTRRVAAISARFDALATAVPDEDEPVVFARRDELLRAVTAWPTADPVARADAILDRMDVELTDVEGQITVPSDTTVTLASERGVVPVTIRRESGPALDVLVEVSPQGRLVVEGDAVRAVALDRNGSATVGFDTRALGTGTFPLVVRVRTPDGALLLAEALISVRATAVSTPALGGIGVVLVVLLLLGRRRRSSSDDERPTLEVVR